MEIRGVVSCGDTIWTEQCTRVAWHVRSVCLSKNCLLQLRVMIARLVRSVRLSEPRAALDPWLGLKAATYWDLLCGRASGGARQLLA